MADISHQKAHALMLQAGEAGFPPEDRLALETHLETCAGCREYQDSLQAVQQKLRRSLHRRWDPAQAHISIQTIQNGSRRQGMFRKLSVIAGTLAVIAAMVLAVRGLSGSLSTPGGPAVTGPASAAVTVATQTATLKPTEPTEPSGTSLPTATTQPPHEYIVRAGDTCSALALFNGVSVQSLIVLNNLSADCMLTVGQVLEIPYPTPMAVPTSSPTPTSNPTSPADCASVVYTVQAGDTLASIAANYQVPAADIRALNGMSSDTVTLGSPLKIPLCNRNVTPNPATASAPGPIRLSKGLSPEEARGPVLWSPDGKHILFTNDADGLLYTVNADGSGLTQLVDFTASILGWTSDNTGIELCTGSPGTQDAKLYSVVFDGSRLTDITNPQVSVALQGSCDIDFSPDKRELAFTRDYGEKGLFVMDADGANLRRVTDPNLHTIRFPFWSQDGSTLYFNALDSAAGDTGSNLYQARIDNGGLKIEARRLSTGERATLLHADGFANQLPGLVGARLPAHGLASILLSPDGSQIAFTSDASGFPHIFVIDADGSNLRFDPIPRAQARIEGWSPDGQSLVFSTVNQGNAYPGFLYLIDLKNLVPYNPATPSNAPSCQAPPDPYTVKAGDTLRSLASHYGVSADDLIAANKLDPQATLFVGQKLHIPQFTPQPGATGVPETIVDYSVQPGDTLASVAALFQVPAAEILSLNQLDPQGSLHAGQLLGIPKHCWTGG